jgi:uncharacterized membrane protein YcaP (DUF421 family)
MFDLGTPAWQIVVRTAVIYIFLLAALRIAGKREIGQMTPFDLVVVLVIANAVQNAMVGPDTSLIGGLLAAAALVTANAAVSYLGFSSRLFERTLIGTPTLLVSDGHLIDAHLRRERVDADEVLMAMREHGVGDIAQVKMAVLEVDGTISIVPEDSKTVRTKRKVRALRHG